MRSCGRPPAGDSCTGIWVCMFRSSLMVSVRPLIRNRAALTGFLLICRSCRRSRSLLQTVGKPVQIGCGFLQMSPFHRREHSRGGSCLRTGFPPCGVRRGRGCFVPNGRRVLTSRHQLKGIFGLKLPVDDAGTDHMVKLCDRAGQGDQLHGNEDMAPPPCDDHGGTLRGISQAL